jgi:hypothetical protein
MMISEPTPKTDCTAFSGPLVGFTHTGSIGHRTHYVLVETAGQTLRLRSNHGTINRAMYDSPLQSHFEGLLDDFGNIVALTIHGEKILNYEEFARDDFVENQWAGWISFVLALACSLLAILAVFTRGRVAGSPVDHLPKVE